MSDWKRMFELKQDDWIDACKEIDALKAEVELLSSAVAQECKCKSAIYICKDCGHQSLGYECKRCLNEAELAQERERSEKLVAALAMLTKFCPAKEEHGTEEDCRVYGCREGRQTLLAAKQDEAPRCKHGVHGNDCRQCYPTINDESI